MPQSLSAKVNFKEKPTFKVRGLYSSFVHLGTLEHTFGKWKKIQPDLTIDICLLSDL
jgi:hypothetical protein